MSNYSSCELILTTLVGFNQTHNSEKITLPDEVEPDTLIIFTDYFKKFKHDINNNNNNNNDNNNNSNKNINDNMESNNERNRISVISSLYETGKCGNNYNGNEYHEAYWTCPRCTYHNAITAKTCHICDTPRTDVSSNNVRFMRKCIIDAISGKSPLNDEGVFLVVLFCVKAMDIEALRLAVDLPRSPVEKLYTLLIFLKLCLRLQIKICARMKVLLSASCLLFFLHYKKFSEFF